MSPMRDNQQVPITYKSIIELAKVGDEWQWAVKIVRVPTGDSIFYDEGRALQFGLACEQAKTAYDRSML